MRNLTILLLCLVLLALAAPSARADTTACIGLPTLPTTISAAGRYCLHKDFSQDFTFSAIIISVDDVVLDCNGHTVTNTLATNSASGVDAGNGRRNVTVRNCILDGFQVGVTLTGSTDPGATGNRIEDNTIRGSRQMGMYVIGSNNRVERNRIVGLRGDVNGVGYGIFMYSPVSYGVGNSIRDNVFADWKPAPPGAGNVINAIYFFRVQETEITGNVISGLYANTNWYVSAIAGSDVTGTLVARNTILSPPPLPAPLDGSQSGGIVLSGTLEQQATNVCRDNVVGHFGSNVVGCVKDGNTEF
jgi:parallel beta-helix repeat protein